MYDLNSKILKIIPLIFLTVIISKIVYTYNDVKKREYTFAKQEAKVLYDYVVANRDYHRKLFVDNTLQLNPNTLKVLPSFSSSIISKEFSEKNSLNITVKTVSDNARNAANKANADELKAIKYFNENKNKTEYFSSENSEFYQFANVLKVDESCLKCHGNIQDAPKIIRDNYSSAYDYNIGEVRGIISINIPTKNLRKYFVEIFFYSVIYDVILLIFLFLGISYLIKKSKNLNTLLETKVKEKTEELKNSLLLERLTRLPNRLRLIDDMSLNENSKSLHLALINIDRFKDINDLYGYEVGDKILKQVALAAQNICENKNSVYKLPSDEYALLTTADLPQKEFLKIVKKLIAKIQETEFEVNDNSIFITLSCGIASNQDSLMTKAYVALQMAKNNSKSIVVYDSTLDTKERITQNIEGVLILKNAIKEDMIIPYFQPIYNTTTKKIEKYESLARIVLQNGEIIPPIRFLDIAIKAKLYPEITKSIVRKSFEFFKEKEYEFSINISIHDIENRKTSKFILDEVQKFPNPKNITFEILESDRVENYGKLNKFIKEIKAHGCKIAIDDFGSGYSNFSHILELNVNYLKIDSSLVKHITKDEGSRVIVKTIINFASNLNLETIAEFVEDKESMDLLEKMGVNFIQGYYIGKPESGLNTDFES